MPPTQSRNEISRRIALQRDSQFHFLTKFPRRDMERPQTRVL
jgi:hypothetical protein